MDAIERKMVRRLMDDMSRHSNYIEKLHVEMHALRSIIQAMIDNCPDPMSRGLFSAYCDAKGAMERTENFRSWLEPPMQEGNS